MASATKKEDPAQDDDALKELQMAVTKARQAVARDEYSKLRTEREKATFAMMMKMNPDALTAIRKEFFVRKDEIDINEFIYIIQKHLNKGGGFEGPEQREFGMKMFDLFKDIDVNGDGNLEWQEFTTYVVEKANLLNKRLKSTSIPHYYDSSEHLDSSAQYRHRHDISKFVNIPTLNQFAMVEDHKNAVFVFNSRLGKHIGTVATESAPVALEYVADKDLLVTSCADMTLSTYSMGDANHNRRYRQRSAWSTPGVQMALAYMPANQLLYSGGTNGNLYSWRIADRSLVSTFTGHTDIVMALTVLQKLNNIASGSLDKTVNVWDSYTNARVLELQGHKKGVLDMTYNPEYRLLFSCGFEHDACVWSPFVNSLVYRFKGHHASLVGIRAIEGTPEVITADISGVFKLWDIRNYNCVQTFTANLTGSDTKDSSKLSCFFQTTLPPANSQQKETDSRIYAASKMLFAFDQARVVHDATTDFTIVQWVGWNEETSSFITVSDSTVICWDALIGSKTVTNSNICANEISACCLDDRKRKIILGDVKGKIGVYNCTNGALMKTVQDHVNSTVVGLEYVNSTRMILAGYSNGIIKIYDENSLEDCNVVKTFDAFNRHPELLCMSFSAPDHTVATAGASSGIVRLWDYCVGKSEIDLKVCDASECVVLVKFLEPYPLVATTDTKGNVCIWGSRGCKWAGKRIAGFMNQTPADAKYEQVARTNPDEEEKPRRIISAIDWDDGEHSTVLEESMIGDDFSVHEHDHYEEDISVASSHKSVESDYLNENSTLALTDEGAPDMVEALKLFADSEATWGRAMSASCLTFVQSNYRLFTGDDLGNIRCFHLKYLMHDIGGRALANTSKFNYRLKDQCAHHPRNSKSALPPIFQKRRKFLVGRLHDAMSFLGVEFCWALAAHHDRIVNITHTENGVLSSGADRFVKMWTFDGEPVGVLLQSVPVGVRSRSWNLEIDAEARMARDEIVLDEVISGVVELSGRDDIPDIETMDMTGIEPGVEAADFSRSELRQRIEMTSDILGIDFPTESEKHRRELLRAAAGDDQHSITSLSTAKSLQSALAELKSSESAVDYKAKVRTLSTMQKRHRAAKMEFVSEKYGEKSGIVVAMDNDAYPNENRPQEEYRSRNVPHVEDDALGKPPVKKQTKPKALSASHTPSSTSLPGMSSSRLRSSTNSASGPRAQSMRTLCSKFSTFAALENALTSPEPNSRLKSAGIAATSSVVTPSVIPEPQRRETTRIHSFHQLVIQNITGQQSRSQTPALTAINESINPEDEEIPRQRLDSSTGFGKLRDEDDEDNV